MALTKADFAAQLLDELGLSKPMAKDLVELFFEESNKETSRWDEAKDYEGVCIPSLIRAQ